MTRGSDERARDGRKQRGPEMVAAGTRLQLDRGARRPSPDLLIGGSPLRFLRLSSDGARQIDRWIAGAPVSGSAGRALATRLVDGGLAHPLPGEGGPTRGEVTAVIPVRDQGAGVAATVGSLGAIGRVLVVDDGSLDPSSVTAAAGGAEVLRHPASRGPAAARNTGWRAADSPFVAFADADCHAEPGWLDRLLPYFADPRVAAVAPRIVAMVKDPGALGRYERRRSPLDLGPRPGPVRPRSWVPYVPTACLVVRRCCLESLGGFDEQLRFGEDVDLVWRLAAAGWAVRYEPRVEIAHPPRDSWSGWVLQRYHYGRSAAALAARHGDAVTPLDVNAWSAAAWALGGLGHPVVGAVVGAGSTMALLRRTRSVPPGELARAALAGHSRAGAALARAMGREWWPAALAAAVLSRRARRAVAVAALVPPLWEWGRDQPGLDPLRWAALRIADGVAYGTGVWAGCVTARSARALRPRWARTGEAARRAPAAPS
jgi:mycofactocin system glycosyltransferase